MPTIPTGKMELELRRLYVRWLSRLSDNTDMNAAVDRFEKQSTDLIEKMGGQTARLGVLADFPAPRRLDLSPHVGTIYSDMKQAAIQAGIQAGLNASDVARHMLRAGMDKSYNRLNRLARTETVSAYWKNAWDSIEDLPELVMVWGSEDGPRTCPWCLERDGMVMESSDLRDHPNGRCTPIPTLRSMVEYKGSVDAGGRIYQDPAWGKGLAEQEASELGAWKPVMSRDEAELWSADSAIKGPLFHATPNRSAVESILKDGFSSSFAGQNSSNPGAMGIGTYFSPDKSAVERFLGDSTEGRIFETRIRVKNPVEFEELILDMSPSYPGYTEFREKFWSTRERSPYTDKELISEFAKLRGHDAIYRNNPRTYELDEVVVFARESVVIVE